MEDEDGVNLSDICRGSIKNDHYRARFKFINTESNKCSNLQKDTQGQAV